MQLNSILSFLLQLTTEQAHRAMMQLLQIDPACSGQYSGVSEKHHSDNRLHNINTEDKIFFYHIKCNRLHFE